MAKTTTVPCKALTCPQFGQGGFHAHWVAEVHTPEKRMFLNFPSFFPKKKEEFGTHNFQAWVLFLFGEVCFFFSSPFSQRKWSSCWDLHIFGRKASPEHVHASLLEEIIFTNFTFQWKHLKYEFTNVVSLIPENSSPYSSFRRRVSVYSQPMSFSCRRKAAFSYKIFAFWAKGT